MMYLKLAQDYSFAHNDDLVFSNLYTGFREFNGIYDSVWKTLAYLYGVDIANKLEAESGF